MAYYPFGELIEVQNLPYKIKKLQTHLFDQVASSTHLIDHKENGYLAHYPSVDDFAEGINWLLQNADEDMRKSANEKINRIMSPKNVALQHIELYKSLLHK